MEKWVRAQFLPGIPLGEDGRRVTVSEKHIEISKNAAKEGMVLLKNEKNALPLSKGTKIALFGKATFDYVKGGGGSGDVTVPYVRNIYEGFCQIIDESLLFSGTVSFYRDCVEKQYADGCVPGLVVEPELPDELLKSAAAFTDTAIISISRFSGEGWDRKADFDKIKEHKGVHSSLVGIADKVFEKGDFYFTNAEEKMIEKVSKEFPRVIVVLNTGGIMETARLAENSNIDAVLLAWQGGMEGGLAEAELLMGIGNPSGKLADTLAGDLVDYPCAESFYESDDYVDYFEDIYVGYRYFETIPGVAEKVVYPFGYGLSYTTFMLSNQKVTVTGDEIIASVHVLNTGKLPGKEVVQIYYSAPQGKLGKPSRELAGYQKTKLLEPGEEQVITIRFSADSMSSYDDLGKVKKSAWILEKGAYTFYIGTSVRDTVQAETAYFLEADRIVQQLTPQMVPTSLTKRMLSDGSFESLPITEPNDPNADALQKMDRSEMKGYCPEVRAVPRGVRPHNDTSVHKLKEVVDGLISLEEFIDQLSDENLAYLLGGQPNIGLADTFGFGNNIKYGIPNIMTADGPAGLRIHEACGVVTTAFPCATLLACTWDPEVTEKIGETGALEVKENNISVWLTPAVCIHRNPLCGRNFEYFSEDPLLTGKQAAAMVRGIQSKGIAATPKHLALNNKESYRKNSDSRASERAIREIYLKQFEIIVKEAKPWCLMSAYNTINGHRACENKDLLTEILRNEWGYDGMVTSDWWTYGEHYKEVLAGNDVKMAHGYPERLLAAKEIGAISREDMEKAAKNVLTLIMRVD